MGDPCRRCGTLRTKAEGGTTFTICDECWAAPYHSRPDGAAQKPATAAEVRAAPAIAAPPREDDALPHAERVEKDRPAYPSLYCAVWPALVPLARSLGYALAIHGSLSRDLDLIAVPWTEEAVAPDALVKAIADKFGAWVGAPDLGPVTRKPHGRMGAIIMLGGHAVVDLSIMPRLPARHGEGG